ncbi:amidohydrolase family protein [Thermodesulfobacteriota bacterium]
MKINCHCHIFSLDYVPLEFRERFGLNVKNPVYSIFHRLIKRLLPEDSKIEEFFGFINMSISEIARMLVDEMDEAGIDICTPLMMDMAYCKGFGGEIKSFEEQIRETVEAVETANSKYDRVRMLPFVAADPRREDVVNIVRDALAGGLFKGVKIYPVMGFTPDDKRLYPIYEYCEENNIPLTTHCENGGIPGLHKYYHMADPKYWATVLKDFPSLKLNLAHNDRTGSDWQPKIAQLILAHSNVYTDISYDTEMLYMPRKYFRSVKRMLNTPKIRDRVLYGSDWYMGRCFWTETSYLKWYMEYSKKIPWCRVEFTENEIRRMTEDNPVNFLGLKNSRVDEE